MDDLLSLSALFAAVVATSAGLTAILTQSWRRPVALNFEEGQTVHLVTPGGSYRCRVVRCGRDGIVTTAPLYRDDYVPLRPRLQVLVQAPCQDGLVTFRSHITTRDKDRRLFTLAPPGTVRRTERRSEPRLTRVEGEAALVNGESGALVDLSANGARVMTTADVAPGDWVRLELPRTGGTAEGWVLGARPGALGDRRALDVRLRFESPFAGLLDRV